MSVQPNKEIFRAKQEFEGTFNLGWLNPFYQRYEHLILGWGTMLVLLALWELAPAMGWVKPLFVSSPSRIFVAAQWLFAHGFWNDIFISAQEFASGFALSILLAIPLGICIGWYRTFHAIFEPLLTLLYATPRVALMPLLILWLGIGIESKVAMVFLGAFFPILLNTISGIRILDPQLLCCARSFCARDDQIFWTIALPSILPMLISGMKLAVGRGLLGVLLGELVASQAGIGHMMSRAAATFQTDKVFVGVVILTVTGYLLTQLLTKIEAYFAHWR